MRPPARLFEVVDSLNIDLLGQSAMALKIAAIQLRRDGKTSVDIRDEVMIESALNESPHVRELAEELMALIDGTAP